MGWLARVGYLEKIGLIKEHGWFSFIFLLRGTLRHIAGLPLFAPCAICRCFVFFQSFTICGIAWLSSLNASMIQKIYVFRDAYKTSPCWLGILASRHSSRRRCHKQEVLTANIIWKLLKTCILCCLSLIWPPRFRVCCSLYLWYVIDETKARWIFSHFPIMFQSKHFAGYKSI